MNNILEQVGTPLLVIDSSSMGSGERGLMATLERAQHSSDGLIVYTYSNATDQRSWLDCNRPASTASRQLSSEHTLPAIVQGAQLGGN